MKSKLKIVQICLMAFLALLALSAHAENGCVEGGPHTNDWSCYQSASLSSSAYINPTNINVFVDQPISIPQIYNVVVTNGVETRSITLDCSPDQDTQEFRNQTNTVSSLYFVPSIPSAIQTAGTYYYTGKVDIASSDGLCPTTVSMGTVTISVINPFYDVDFGNKTNSAKTGYAMIGAFTNDFWNEADSNNVPNLKNVDGIFSSVGLMITNITGVSSNSSPDPMFNDYAYAPTGQVATVTITNLPTGTWNLYLYASDGNFDLKVGTNDYGTQTCFDPFLSITPIWRQGTHYVLFSNVSVPNGQNATVTVQPGTNGYAMISGLQIATVLPTASPASSVPSGIESWWRAESNALDSIGTNNGTLINGASYTAGEVGLAFKLPVSGNSYVQVPDNNLWAFGTNNFSIELWANFNPLYSSLVGEPNDGVFISNDEGSGNDNKWWFAFGGAKLTFHINSPTFGPIFLVQAPFTPITNQWYHFAVVRNGNLYTIYTNGAVIGSQTDTNTIPNPNAPLTIGKAESFNFDGLLDEVSIYNRALSPSEILSIYDAGVAGKYVDSDYDGVSDAQEAADRTNPNDANDYPHVQLGHWRFDDTNIWIGDQGQLPIAFTNTTGIPSWDTNAVQIDSMNIAYLKYNEVDTNGANINLRHGSIRFWLNPDWSSVSAGGTGPQDQGRLIEIGQQGTNTGWWTLMLDTNGNTLSFLTQTNGVGMTNLSAAISWNSNTWHQIVLTYGASNSSLYIDGQAVVTNGAGIQYWPSAAERSSGFAIGSDAGGNNQAGGIFDELDTFNYPLGAQQILTDYGICLPHSIAGLQLWLKADAIIGLTNTAAIGTWPDISGLNNDATQSDTNFQPIYVTSGVNGYPAVRFGFGGTSNAFFLPTTLLNGSTGAEAFVVLKVATNALSAPRSLWDMGGNAYEYYPFTDGTIQENFGINSQINFNLGVPLQPLTQYHVYQVTAQTNDWGAWIDGQLLHHTTVNDYNFSATPMLGEFSAFSTFFDGDIAEVLIFSRPLTTFERTTVNEYLNGKYGFVPVISIASPTNNAYFTAPSNIGLNVNVSEASGGTIKQVEYFEGANSLGISTNLPYSLTWNNASVGPHLLTAQATGDNGLTATSTVVDIAVDPTPSVSIIMPTNNLILTAPANISISATVVDRPPISHIQLFQGSTSLGIITNSPYTLTWSNVTDGVYGLTAVAIDSNGLVLTSSVVNVIVDTDPTTADRDGDGLSDWEEYTNGTDPLDYYNGNLPVLAIVEGNNQIGLTNEWLPFPLTVQLTDASGTLLTNAPLTFAVASGSGLIATSNMGTTSSSLQLRTETNGQALVWLQLPSTNGSNIVTAITQSGTNITQVTFKENTGIIPMITVGGESIMELTTNGDVVSWGGNQYGEFGDYTHLDSDAPSLASNVAVHVVGLTNIIKIASGGNFSLAVDLNGTLWAWGDNSYGQLGDNGVENGTNRPVQVLGMTNTVAISAFGDEADGFGEYALAVKADGTVWAWGSLDQRYFSDISFGSFQTSSVPVQITGISNAVSVVAGSDAMYVLLSDGTVRASGEQGSGQLGNGVSGVSSVDSPDPVTVSGLKNISAIAAGFGYGLALSNGIVWAWGYNGQGQLGASVGTTVNTPVAVANISSIVSIAAGEDRSMAVDGQGNVWVWGNHTNYPTLVSNPNNAISCAAIENGDGYNLAVLDQGGNVWWWGNLSEALGSTNIPAMLAGYTDFYDGVLPNLAIISGNNQTNYAGSEWPMIFRVTDAGGVALTNAPISVEVVSGDMEIHTNAGGTDFKGLRLTMTTDTNGEVCLRGYVDLNPSNPYGLVRVLAASREQVREIDFNEILTALPTVSITSPEDGGTSLIGTNQPLFITVDAQAGYPRSIQEVDYSYQANGGDMMSLGSSTESPFTFTWTNASWWLNDFVGQYTFFAVAKDDLGTWSVTNSVTTTIALDTYWFGIPDYLIDTNGTLAAWQTKYFGYLGLDPNGDYDGDGTNNLQEFLNGTDPNKISFSFSMPNQYVDTNIVNGVITVLGGVPSSEAILVSDTNLADASWSPYTSSNIVVTLGSTDGVYDVWIGLRGLPSDAHQTWTETTLILGSMLPTISITNPVDGDPMNASRVDVSGTFSAASIKQISVNGVTAFVNGTNFEAVNVPLTGGPNTITAVIEDLNGDTNSASINITGTTNSDGSMNNPVQLSAAPVAGFAPLAVTFSNQVNVPGTIEQVSYDFNGDDIADFVTNNLDFITYTYATNGVYFPVVTIQTDAGRFSSVGGWNAVALDPSNQPVQINVQSAPTQTTLASVTDPVDLKWDGSHLYVLSGSTATITEFCTNGTSIRCKSGIGTNPSGFDVDGAGNVYVAVTASNQVWKFFPTNSSFQADTNFGVGGCIGLTNGLSGTDTNEFNAPFDVAVNGGTISVSDSGNNRIQQFDTNGNFIASFGSSGSDVGQFNTPKGLTYDSVGTLYIVDSGNNRIVMAQGTSVEGVTGTYGTALAQLGGPVNISVGERGVYVADTGNNRIQSFKPAVADNLFSIDSSTIRFADSTNFIAPAAVAAVDSLTNEMFYVADTGNNQVLLCNAPNNNLDAIQSVWNSMTNNLVSGDIEGALTFFSVAAQDDYRQTFLSVGSANAASAVSQIGALTPVYVNDFKAEYYFTNTIAGQIITFPVEFDNENGVWKILEF